MKSAQVDANTTVEDDATNWKLVPAEDDLPAYYVYTEPIQKSPADDREYRIIRLENGLEATLVHEEKTDKAAASLNVAVGSFHDPDDIPGLAHLCEHLSFLGSDEFPKENEYDEYLSKNTGYANAWTTGSGACYYFSVASHALEGTLHRFSAFFHCPRFNEGTALREINAVDSEHSDNLQDDDWRIDRIENILARPGHPLRKFGTGNKKTLMQVGRAGKTLSSKKIRTEKRDEKDKHSRRSKASTETSASESPVRSVQEAEENAASMETRRRLIEWWKKEYCASRMSLAVVGKESLDDLVRFVAKFFSPIKNRGQDPAPLLSEQPYGKNELGKIVHVKTITDVYGVTVSFPIAWQAPQWRAVPADFVAHLIGHEGPGSLHAYLKNKGWLSELCAGSEEIGRGVSLFRVSMELTKDGFKNYREVVLTCFKFINLLHESKLPEWAQDEIKILNELSFRFDEKVEATAYAQYISNMMKLPIPRMLLLSGCRLSWGWDETLVRETLERLHIGNCFIMVTAQDHNQIGKTGPWLIEPLYGAQYIEEKLNEDFVSAARKENDICELALLKPNEFIPRSVDIQKVNVSEPRKRPSLIRRTSLTELWQKKDDQFWVPRAQVKISARTPFAGATARDLVMTRLFSYIVEDSLTEYSYDACVAGLSYDFSGTIRGVSITIDGYNDKLHVLAQHVLEKVKHLEIQKDRFAVMIEKAELELENVLLEDPHVLSEYYLAYLLEDRDFTVEEQLKALEDITVEGLRKHVKTLLSQFKYTVLVTGNLRKEDALRITSMAEDILDAKPVPADKLPDDRSRLLPKACNYIWELPVPNPDQVNSSISYYCHVGSSSDPRTRVVCYLMGQIIEEPAFTTLRTKEQLAYLVVPSSLQNIESIGWRIVIQSEKDPKFLESRIEAFLIHVRGKLEKMEDGEFEEHKKALENEWLEKLKNLSEETARFWAAIRSGYYDFQRHEKDAMLIQSISKSDVLTMFKRFLDPASPTRSKFSVHMRPQTPPAPKFSKHAAQAFLHVLQKAGIDVNEEEFNSECEDEPPIAQVRAYWEEGLREQLEDDDKKMQKLLDKFDRIAEKYPVKGQGPVELDSKVIFIEDAAKFREALVLSGTPKPVAEFEVE